ncbi:MAG: zinc ribbon domain-containing protein [Deltaproteobacteria bacterium]|nr:zinc ribbon domain-containing protein [Deltaproteobacteria bacterium]MBW1952371.1 zinc ribbon domain-containing protein [Deltaproteobacteria bacterium]MBW1986483.1 zinc ribbon domain-containing protein [Deltaproteobacteria bacterium]MBW2135457.1 zinc ribbon domain-containing protein [Deltaproteobacteria bacterium]
MSYCPQCHLVHGESQHFCQRCGQPLIKAESVPHLPCPNCGALTLPGQNYCTECGHQVRTKGQNIGSSGRPARERLFYPTRGDAGNSKRWQGRTGVWLAGMGVLLSLSLLLYFWTREPSPTTHSLPFTPGHTYQPSTKIENLQKEVEHITEKIRASHLNKDINRFMSCYHSAYPDLGRLEALTLENWKNYDFKNISYHISNLQVIGPNQVSAEVVWNFQLYNHQTKAYELHRAAFQIILQQTGDSWKIRESKELGYS